MPKNNEARTIVEQVIPYLISLGYPEHLIRTDIRTNQGRRPDVVVYSSPDEPLIAVEAKSSTTILPQSNDSALRFDPLVRQTHLYAKELKARYFLLTNGADYLWFTTDSAGRPQLITEPPQFGASTTPKTKISSKSFLTDVFLRLRDYKYSTEDVDIPFLLILKVLQDREGIGIEGALRKIKNQFRGTPFSDSIFDISNKLFSPKVMDILGQVDFSEFSSSELLSSIDSIFINNNLRSRDFRVARWLADFMIQLAEISDSSRVLDLSCGFGDILAAAKLSAMGIDSDATIGYSYNESTAKWAILQEYILGQDLHNIVIENPLHLSREHPNITHIVFAPPFGGKINDYVGNSVLFENGVRNYEDILLERAIKVLGKHNKGRIVMLVPEGMLFMKGIRAFTRKFILENLDVRGIISLQQGALAAYAMVKTSILILDTKSNLQSHEIFMAHADQFPGRNSFYASESPQLTEVVQAFKQWSTDSREAKDSDIFWGIKTDSINIDNFSVTNYRSSESDLVSLSNFETVPLATVVTFISRGRAIKLDNKGKIRVIGPGAIRALNIDSDGILTTTEENLPPNPLMVESDDILMNNIGSYLGQSAVAESKLRGNYVSQHVMIIRCDKDLVIPDYLAIALNSDFVKSQLLKKSSGTLIPSNSRRGLESIEIPLPALEIQKLIVQKVYSAKKELVSANKLLNKLQNDFNDLLDNPFDAGENK